MEWIVQEYWGTEKLVNRVVKIIQVQFSSVKVKLLAETIAVWLMKRRARNRFNKTGSCSWNMTQNIESAAGWKEKHEGGRAVGWRGKVAGRRNLWQET